MINRSTQSTACEGSQRCAEECVPHRYCRPAVLSRSVPRHRRSRRHGGGLSLLLAAVALTGSGCALSGHPASPPSPHVLGEPKGTPLAVGQPAPAGTGELGAVSCANARRCWAVGVAGPESGPGGDRHGRDRRHHQRGQVVEGATGGRREHAAAERDLVPDPDRLHGGRIERGVAARERRGRDDHRRGRDVVARNVAAECPRRQRCGVRRPEPTAPSSSATAPRRGPTTAPTSGRAGNRRASSRRRSSAGNDLTCVAGGSCLVAGYVPTSNGHGAGAVALSADGGQTWSLATVPAGIGLLQSVACLTAAECLAAGTTNTTVSDVVPAKGELLAARTGATPGRRRPARCPSTTSSASPARPPSSAPWWGHGGSASRPSPPGRSPRASTAGVTFRISPTAYTPITLTALSCPTTTGCVAVGEDTVARLTLLKPKPPPAASRSHGVTTAPRGPRARKAA